MIDFYDPAQQSNLKIEILTNMKGTSIVNLVYHLATLYSTKIEGIHAWR